MYKPYPIQQKEIDKITDFVKGKSKKKGVFVMPVGGGKSLIIANVAMNFPEKYFINIAPNKELVQQNYETYKSYGFDASVCSASLGSNEVSQVTFATIGTLKKHYDFFKDKDVVLIQDEADSNSLKKSELDKFFKKLNKCKLMGVTATPMRLNNTKGGSKLSMMNRQRDCMYTSIESVVQVKDVIKNNMWSKVFYEVEDVDEEKLELNTTGSDYTLKSLEAFSEANDIKQKCIEAVYRLREEGRESCIVYVTTIKEAEFVASKIDNAEVLHSKLKKKKRDEVVNGLKTGKIKTVVNVGILIKGFNYPGLSSIVIARPTNSYTLFYQAVGRLVRKTENKKDGKVVDISGNYNKFGAIEDLEIIKEDWCGGWAAFSGERLLTNYALGSSIVPTKESLKEHYKNKNQNFDTNPKMPFGKHKGYRLSAVKQKDEKYLAWMTDEKTGFKYYGEKGLELKKAIYHMLKLPFDGFDDVVMETQTMPF